MMYLHLFVLIVAAEATEWHLGLRHRQLPKSCLDKQDYCTLADKCCGKRECARWSTETESLMCCVLQDDKGCDTDADCCLGEDPDTGETIELECLDSACALSLEDPVGAPCEIHGAVCEPDGVGGSGSCCGEVKYICEKVKGSELPQCCMPLYAKGCSFDIHCCDDPQGETICEESTCKLVDVTLPPEDRCSKKGEVCEVVGDCCGSTKYNCEVVVVGDSPTCCIKAGLHGCELDEQCCTGFCDLDASLCCSEINQECASSNECCYDGTYCASGTCANCKPDNESCESNEECCNACVSGTCSI